MTLCATCLYCKFQRVAFNSEVLLVNVSEVDYFSWIYINITITPKEFSIRRPIFLTIVHETKNSKLSSVFDMMIFNVLCSFPSFE